MLLCSLQNLRGEAAHLVLRLLRRDARFQSPDRIDKVGAALIRIAVKREGHPRFHGVTVGQRAIGVARVLRAGGHDSDYGIGRAIQQDDFAENRGVGGEAAAPQTVAQNDACAVPHAFVRSRELASPRRLDAEDGEVSGGDSNGRNEFGLARAGELDIAMEEPGQPFEDMVALAEIVKVPGVQRESGKRSAGEEGANQTVGLGIRQRRDQHAVDHAEDGAVGADGQG